MFYFTMSLLHIGMSIGLLPCDKLIVDEEQFHTLAETDFRLFDHKIAIVR